MKARCCALVALTLALLSLSGCGNKFFDPAQIGRFRPAPAVNIILDSLGVAEEAPAAWEHGEEPRLEDTIAVAADYTLGSGDVLRISIFELYAEGRMDVQEYVITESGKISIPEVGVLSAGGMTELQLEEHIKETLRPAHIRNPSVSVILLNSRRRRCAVIGDGVDLPGPQIIPRFDYRLTDALAAARGPRQFNVSYIYVLRLEPPVRTDDLVGHETPVDAPLAAADPALVGSRSDQPAFPVERPAAGQKAVNLDRQWRRFEQPFNVERQMLGMATPTIRKLWDESEQMIMASSIFPREPQGLPLISASEFQRLSRPNPSAALNASTHGTDGALREVGSLPDPGGDPAADIEWIFQEGKWIAVPRSRPSVTAPRRAVPQSFPAMPAPRVRLPAERPMPTPTPAAAAQIEWVFKDGQWIAVPAAGPAVAVPQPRFERDRLILPLDSPPAAATEGWESARRTRVIKIPADRLLTGDLRYNIIIKPGDTIHVPVDMVGEFYIMGNVNRTGVINMTGRPITLMQAIAAAGGLGPLAYPKQCEVRRRLGRNGEVVVLVDLDKIAAGEQPDFFIKPNDLINVGTHFSSRWRAVLRNAFRAAYGFGFVYDRNFADADFGKGWPKWL